MVMFLEYKKYLKLESQQLVTVCNGKFTNDLEYI